MKKIHYTNQISKLHFEIIRLKRIAHYHVVAELTFLSIALLFIILFSNNHNYFYFIGILLGTFIYVIIRKKDIRTERIIENKNNKIYVYKKELSYINGDYSCFDDGSDYINLFHNYTFDLDIFGKDSLFQRINRTVTRGGRDYLAKELSNTNLKSLNEILERQKALNELSNQETLRTEFLSIGQYGQIDTEQILNVISSIKKRRIQQIAYKRIKTTIALVAISISVILLIGSFIGLISAIVPIVWCITQFLFVFLICIRSIRDITSIVGNLLSQIEPYICLISIVSKAKVKCKENISIINCLSTEENSAIHAFNELKCILDSLDRRGNVIGMVMFNALFLSDFFLVQRFLHWRMLYLDEIEKWISAISHFDALVSMSTFQYNETSSVNPIIVESDKVIYEATGITHPFLGKNAISNNFYLKDRHFYIITGANMAGKSTFLRSIGLNYVLANCGMRVFAKKIRISIFSLFTNMRTTDDLSRGISYFNAELLRLKKLVTEVKHNKNTLIILDEILKGTNSSDKLNGSMLFLEKISLLNVTGIMATHDLELSKLEETHPSRFHNYCFEIELSDEIVYTYKISKGIACNQNATFMLQKIIQECSKCDI